MAVKPFTKEELNFFKFSSVVLDEFPKMLRHTFVTLWDNKIAALSGYQAWDDSATDRNRLLAKEGGKTDIPTYKSFCDWDCTALFKATIYCKTFALTTAKGTKPLSQQYLNIKGKTPSPFHLSVISPTGNRDETVTLAIDQLRLLRNTLCHTSSSNISKADFSQYIQLATDSFTAVGVSTLRINDIGCLGESDFPTEKLNELNQRITSELQENNKFLQQEVMDEILGIKFAQESRFHEIDEKLEDVKKDIIGQAYRNVQSPPESCVPQLIPEFVGRNRECQAVVHSMMSNSTRLFSIWGSPGFGKTSTAIAIGNHVKSQGKSIYYFTLRGVNTVEGFTSKLLGFFGRSTELNRTVAVSPADELLRAFGSITTRFFVILDNLDDLLTSSDKKEEVLNFINEVLHRCQNVCFLTTTRDSLEFLSLRMQGFDSLRLKPLDAQSTEMLILRFLPSTTTADVKSEISKMCGNVPLAIRLLCAFIQDSPGELLNEIGRGADSLLNVIDDPNYLCHDSRLKQLIQVSFGRLSTDEKDAFISLSVFNGTEFELDAAVSVIGGGKLRAKRNLENLKRKSLIDINSECEMFTVHPLIQSFALEKGEKVMKTVLASSKNRFLEYFINLFQDLNLRFLRGESMAAFKKFYMEQQRILSSLSNGLNDDELFEKVVDVLEKCEFFLDSLFPNSLTEIELLYDLSLSKMSDRKIDGEYAGLYVSKQFYATTFVSKTNSVLPPEDSETSKKLSLLPVSTQGKFLCYKGIYELSNGGGEPAVQHIEDGLFRLNNNPDQVILKILTLQFLAIYYKYSGNSVKFEQFREQAVLICTLKSPSLLLPVFGNARENLEEHSVQASLRNQPLISWVMARLSLWTRKYPWPELDNELCYKLEHTLQQLGNSSLLIWTTEVCTVLQLCDMAYIYSCISNDQSHFEEIVKNLLMDVEKMKGEQNENNEAFKTSQKRLVLLQERLATYYHTMAVHHFGNRESALEFFFNELDVRRQLPADVKLAESYRCVGNEHNSRREYRCSLEMHKRSLETLIGIFGEIHADVATSHYNIGIVQDNMGDSEASLESYFCALKITLKLFGGHHPQTMRIQERIENHPFSLSHRKVESCDYAARTLSHRKKLVRVKLSSASKNKQWRTELSSHPELFRVLGENEHHSETVQFCFFA